jgi:hypothetical protein
MQVTIGGEPRSLGDFSAYKAFKAMELMAAAESVVREVVREGARFKREHEAENFVVMDRAEARRQFRPRPLERIVREEGEDGRIAVREEPVLDAAGEPVLGPDPLGHLTDADWEASSNQLRISESPSERMQGAAMIPIAFRLGREQVMRLLALVLAANSDLERWETDGDVDAELDQAARALLHRARADELLELAGAALQLCREQVAGPFERLMETERTTFAQPDSEPEEGKVPEPMQVEIEDETPSSPASSTDSPAATAGSPPSSSTAPVGASSSSSESA